MGIQDKGQMAGEAGFAAEAGAISVLAGSATGLSLVSAQEVGDLGKPFANRIMLIEDAYVAGTTHVEGLAEMIEGVQEGCRLEFLRDPENIFDEWAIKVMLPGKGRIGYLPADLNQITARLMDGGKCVFGQVSRIEQLGRWTKISMEVYLDD